MVNLPFRQWVKWVVLSFVGLILIWQGAEYIANRQLRKFLDRRAAEYGAHVVDDYTLRTDLVEGSVVLSNFRIQPTREALTPFSFEGSVDTIAVFGVSWTRALFTGLCVVEELVVSGSDIRIIERASDTSLVAPEPSKRSLLKRVVVERTNLALSSLRYSAFPDTMASSLGSLILSVNDVQLSVEPGMWQRTTWNDLDMKLAEAHFETRSGLMFGVKQLIISQRDSSAQFYGLNGGPRDGLEAYNATLSTERDVFEGTLDTLRFDHVDLGGLDPERLGRGGNVHIASGAFTILRDKSKRDPPYLEKPILAKLVRGFGEDRGADTIFMRHVDVTYMERNEQGGAAAHMPFVGINALITGARAQSDAEISVNATASVFDGTPISLRLTAPVEREDERFTMQAKVGRLAFSSLNRAMVPLTDIEADEGRLDTLVLNMTADVNSGNGTIALVYRDLRFKSTSKNAKGSVTTALLGLLRRSNRTKDGIAETVAFDVERRKDRAIFNYLWSGLREGVKSGLMPKPLSLP